MIQTGSRVKVIDILDKIEGEHLVKFIGYEGEVWSYNYMTDEDKINDKKRCKVKLDNIEGTYYFIADGELEQIEHKGKIVCLIGKSGSGKSTIEKELQKFGLVRIISTTTRPIRENEKDGIDYNYMSDDKFLTKLKNGDFIENTKYNNWHYGIDKYQLNLNNNDYVVVIEPHGYNQLKEALGKENIIPIYVYINDKQRVLRSLNREENPNVYEICRRLVSDTLLFKEIEEDESIFKVENLNYWKAIREIKDYINSRKGV